MARLLTTAEVAKHYGVTPGRIRQVVGRCGLSAAGTAGRGSLWKPSQLPDLNPRKIRKSRRRLSLGGNRSKS